MEHPVVGLRRGLRIRKSERHAAIAVPCYGICIIVFWRSEHRLTLHCLSPSKESFLLLASSRRRYPQQYPSQRTLCGHARSFEHITKHESKVANPISPRVTAIAAGLVK